MDWTSFSAGFGTAFAVFFVLRIAYEEGRKSAIMERDERIKEEPDGK